MTEQPHEVEPGAQEASPAVHVVRNGARPAHARAVSRRGLLGLLGAGAAGVAVGAGGAVASTHRRQITPPPVGPQPPAAEDIIRHSYSPHGRHQAGIVTPLPAVTSHVALTLRAGVDRAGLGRLLREWSTDIAALMAGRSVPGDTAPEMAQGKTSLSVTVGLGPGVFALEGLQAKMPAGFIVVPPMKHDALDPRWSGGDLLLIVAADDPTTVAYAARVLIRDAAPWADLRWVQKGSWRGTNEDGKATTGRNLFGQPTGTANPTGAELEGALWSDDDTWFSGGTQLVVRRIQMDVPGWERVSRERQERVLGRRSATGEPLTGGAETGTPDFEALDAQGNLVIPADAHIRRAHPTQNGGRRILRRVANYTHEEFVDGGLRATSGLVFSAFCASIERQYVPVQQSLDASDALNEWTKAIGSAVFVIPPGYSQGSWIAQKLVEG